MTANRKTTPVDHQNHLVQTQTRITTILVRTVVDAFGGRHGLGDVEAKVKLYHALYGAYMADGLLDEAEPYLKAVRDSFMPT